MRCGINIKNMNKVKVKPSSNRGNTKTVKIKMHPKMNIRFKTNNKGNERRKGL